MESFARAGGPWAPDSWAPSGCLSVLGFRARVVWRRGPIEKCWPATCARLARADAVLRDDRYRLTRPALAVLPSSRWADRAGDVGGRVRIDFAGAALGRRVIVFAPFRARDAQHGSWTFSADGVRLLIAELIGGGRAFARAAKLAGPGENASLSTAREPICRILFRYGIALEPWAKYGASPAGSRPRHSSQRCRSLGRLSLAYARAGGRPMRPAARMLGLVPAAGASCC